MANYYEMLKISPNASPQEISNALDTQYEQWRRLVTHHDPNVVNQANQALQLLEQIRATLTDPTKRAAYDEGIGLRSVGGLADPTAILNMPSTVMTPPAPRPIPVPAQPGLVAPSSPALWTCPKCSKENPPNTRFCFSCGTQLVRTCPECRQETSLVATGFCGNCGYIYDVAAQRLALAGELAGYDNQVTYASQRLREASARSFTNLIWWGLGGAGVALLSLGALGSSSSAGCGLMGILLGGVVAAACFIAYGNASSKKNSDIQNAQDEIARARSERNRVNQERETLALRKTERS